MNVKSITVSASSTRDSYGMTFTLTSIPNYSSKTLWKNLFPSFVGIKLWAYDDDDFSASMSCSYTPSTGKLWVGTGMRSSSWGGTTQKITVYYI